jgi:hypothetical protein
VTIDFPTLEYDREDLCLADRAFGNLERATVEGDDVGKLTDFKRAGNIFQEVRILSRVFGTSGK